MEGLDIDNILSPDEIESLFTEGTEQTEQQEPQPDEKNEENKDEKTTEVVDPESLFKPESVGSGKEDTQGKEDTKSDDSGTSPNTNFYSSLASALKDEGILPDLDDDSVGKINTPEDFAAAIDAHIKSQFDERQRRIDEALEVGMEPSEIKQYENTLSYLDTITETAITDESKKGEELRRRLILQDFMNRGYSKERATREVEKSFNAGSDIEDAKEALIGTKEYFEREYKTLIEEAKREEEEEKSKLKKQAEELKKSILEDKQIFEGVELDRNTRKKIYDSISKPIYKTEDGEYLTAIQKYERENRTDFLKKLGLLFTMTDGFTNLDKLIKPSVNKKVKSSLRELEHKINSTSRTSDGNLAFVTGVDDMDSESKWTLDLS